MPFMLGAALAAAMMTDPLKCNVPLLGTPATANAASEAAPARTTPNGLGILYAGFGMTAPYGISATFTLPKSNTNSGLFYTDWMLLASRDSKSFLQIELMRWSKYSYRNEIALTWALPDGLLQYRDTPVFVSDDSHGLGIDVSSDSITLRGDKSVTCTASFADFYASAERIYYQIGNEVVGVGDRPTGTVSNIRGFDKTHALQPITPRCRYSGYGLSWLDLGNAAYRAAGALDPKAPAQFLPGCDLTGFTNIE